MFEFLPIDFLLMILGTLIYIAILFLIFYLENRNLPDFS